MFTSGGRLPAATARIATISGLKKKPSGPLGIFLSHGHDANEDLVRRIKADLEKRGHDVWFDKNEIKFGDEWRRSLKNGILKSNRVLSFLSKCSTRDPGVCRDEIAIAVGVKGGNIKILLVESEQEMQPPANIGCFQWLDIHDWKEGHGIVHIAKDRPVVGEAAWKQWYQAKLAEIVRVARSKRSTATSNPSSPTLASAICSAKASMDANGCLRQWTNGGVHQLELPRPAAKRKESARVRGFRATLMATPALSTPPA